MALGAVLVDRARRLGAAATEKRVGGTTIMRGDPGPWFRARLELAAAPEAPGPGGGPRRAVPAPTLMFKPADDAGNPIGMTAADRVEVESAELGSAVYRVNGEPRPMRKKRRVIGYVATLERVEERPFEPRRAP